MRIPLIVTLLFAMMMPQQQNVQLPRPPAELKGVSARAGWLVEHFWDLAEVEAVVADHSASKAGETSVLEQSMVNWFSLFPLTQSDSLCRVAVGAFLGKASGNVAPVLDIADKYLYTPDSPMACDEHYLFFVEGALGLEGCCSGGLDKDLLAYRRKVLMNNRVGSEISDFSFETRDGSLVDFSSITGPRLLLFFDIECSECRQMIASLRESGAGADQTVVVVAINATAAQFREFAGTLPSSWVCGYDSTATINGGAFAFRHLPLLLSVSAEGVITSKGFKL